MAHHRRMSDGEILALADGGLIDVGVHTATHPTLSALPDDRQITEIETNKQYLEQVLGQPVTALAYPFGNFSPETVGITRSSGFSCGCTTARRLIRHYADPFRLPRCHVENLDGDAFGRWLEGAWKWPE